ncbi:MAG: hypothetical protein JO317_02590, partial [Verrucomicrobiae bacterium]|nr:hypothetical protein [Verrucomicrobiae bacterium]
MSARDSQKPFLIGVAGGTGSGKTYLTLELAGLWKGRASVIHADWYYRDQSHVGGEARLKLNFDHPKAIEATLLAADLRRLREGRPASAPHYDYATHRRTPDANPIEPRPFLLVEGLFVLHEPLIRKALDYAIFLEITPDQRLIHRLRRDQGARGITIEETLRLYENFARPMHELFVQPSSRHANEVMHDLPTDAEIRRLARKLEKMAALQAAPAAGDP